MIKIALSLFPICGGIAVTLAQDNIYVEALAVLFIALFGIICGQCIVRLSIEIESKSRTEHIEGEYLKRGEK